MFANGCISWESTKQRSTAMSTAETEYLYGVDRGGERSCLLKKKFNIATAKLRS